jgi:predicted transcriptional regulator
MLAEPSKSPEAEVKPRRTHLDITLDILDVCRTDTKKTHILYRAGINFYQVQKQLAMLLATGLLEKTIRGYRTTEKGRLLITLLDPMGK